MKKKSSAAASSRTATRKSSIVAAASLFVLPMVMVSNRAEAQTKAPGGPPPSGPTKPGPGTLSFNFSKISTEYVIIGVHGRSPVFMDADHNYFILKPNGDLQFLERKSVSDSKHKSEANYDYLKIKMHNFGESGKVSILGLNKDGDIVIKNAKNEKAVLGANGDKVVVKP